MEATRKKDIELLRSIKCIDELFFRKRTLISLCDKVPNFLNDPENTDNTIDTMISLLETRRAYTISEALYICTALKESEGESVSDLLERLSRKD